MALTYTQEKEIVNLVHNFEDTFYRARRDWAKYKAGMQYNLFPVNKQREILEWYAEFPKLWEMIRLNWEASDLGPPSPANIEFADEVNSWIKKLSSELNTGEGLGFVFSTTALIIAGILAAGGTVGVIWGISYLKKQNNLSKLIDATVSGQVPPDILEQAIKNEESGGFFGGIKSAVGSITKLGVGGLVVYMLSPWLSKITSGKVKLSGKGWKL